MHAVYCQVLAVGIFGAAIACSSNQGGSSSSGAPEGATSSTGSTSHAGSSSTGLGTCPSVAPCAGNLVGTWRVTQACGTSGSSSSACAGATASVLDFNLTGTITFNSDGTYSTAFAGSTTLTSDTPLGCLTGELDGGGDFDAGVAACESIGTALSTQDSGLTGSCSVSGSNCDCTETAPITSADGGLGTSTTGTYSTSGSTVTTTETGGTPSSASYCVQGNTLYWTSAPSDAGGGGSTLVATKQ